MLLAALVIFAAAAVASWAAGVPRWSARPKRRTTALLAGLAIPLSWLLCAAGAVLLVVAGGRGLAGDTDTLRLGNLGGLGSAALRTDPLSALFLVIAFAVAVPVLLAAASPVAASRPRLPAAVALTLAAVEVIVTSDHLFVLLFGWEGLTVAFYLLAGFDRNEPGRPRAAVITAAFGKVSGAALLIGGLLLAGHATPSAWRRSPRGSAERRGRPLCVAAVRVRGQGRAGAGAGVAAARLCRGPRPGPGGDGRGRRQRRLLRHVAHLAGARRAAGVAGRRGPGHRRSHRDPRHRACGCARRPGLPRRLVQRRERRGDHRRFRRRVGRRRRAQPEADRGRAAGRHSAGLRPLVGQSAAVRRHRHHRAGHRHHRPGLVARRGPSPAVGRRRAGDRVTHPGRAAADRRLRLGVVHPRVADAAVPGRHAAHAAGHSRRGCARRADRRRRGRDVRAAGRADGVRSPTRRARHRRLGRGRPRAAAPDRRRPAGGRLPRRSRGRTPRGAPDRHGPVPDRRRPDPRRAGLPVGAAAGVLRFLGAIPDLAVDRHSGTRRANRPGHRRVLRRRLWRVRRVLAWSSASPGVEGNVGYTSFGYANPMRKVLANLLLTRGELRREEARTGGQIGGEDQGAAGVRLGYTVDVVEVVGHYVYRPLGGMLLAVVRTAKRLQSGRLDAYLAYMLIALVAVLAVVAGTA